ncbi:MAG: hypothetical protein AAGH99_13205 [Planctomycetota bacterium]
MIGLSLTAAVSVALPLQAQDAKEIERQIEQIEAAKQLTDQIERELQQASQQIEDEQRALLDRLGRTHDDLQNEKQHNRELQRQLDQLLGTTEAQPPAAEETTPTQSATGTIFVPWIERSINALGLVQRQRTTLAPVPPGVNGLTLRLHTTPDADTATSPIKLNHAGPKVTLEQPAPTGKPRTLATLSVADGELAWTWHSFSPSAVLDGLSMLDEQLRYAVIETKIDGVAVGRYQFEPNTIVLPRGDGPGPHRASVPSPPPGLEASLAHPAQDAGWVLLEDTPNQLVWARSDRSLAMRFDGADLTWEFGPGIAARLEEIKRQRTLWEQDLNRPQSGTSIDAQRSADHLQTLTDAEDQLRQALDATRGGAGDLDSLSFEIVGPRPNMIFHRVTFASP